VISIKNNRLDTIAQSHYAAIKKHLKNPRLRFNYEKINSWFLNNGSKQSLKEVILADFENLKLIKESYYDVRNDLESEYIRNVIYKNYFSQSNITMKNTKYNAAKLIDELGLIVCPYCNRNFINNIKFNNGVSKRTSQMDHFFSKDKYPFLAMSFYNLIPCCPSCNHVKSNNEIGFSPYDIYANQDKYKFNYIVKTSEYLSDISQIDLILESNSIEYEKNIKVFGLRELYSVHKDVVQEILKKKHIYNESKIKEIYKDFNKLFRDTEDVRNTIFGNFIDDKDFNKRPLAKLINDIYHN